MLQLADLAALLQAQRMPSTEQNPPLYSSVPIDSRVPPLFPCSHAPPSFSFPACLPPPSPPWEPIPVPMGACSCTVLTHTSNAYASCHCENARVLRCTRPVPHCEGLPGHVSLLRRPHQRMPCPAPVGRPRRSHLSYAPHSTLLLPFLCVTACSPCTLMQCQHSAQCRPAIAGSAVSV